MKFFTNVSFNLIPGFELGCSDFDRTDPKVEGDGEGRQQKVETSDRSRRTSRDDSRQRIGGKVSETWLQLVWHY